MVYIRIVSYRQRDIIFGGKPNNAMSIVHTIPNNYCDKWVVKSSPNL
jgi:hypothetical protein